MVERHLYDTIPQAWVALGGTKIPPAIPKSYGAAAATATIVREDLITDSFAGRLPQSTSLSPSSSQAGAINFHGATIRRMSTRQNETDEESEASIWNFITRRQAIQVDMFRGPSTSSMNLCLHFPTIFLVI